MMFSLGATTSKLFDEAFSSLLLYKEIDKWMNDKLTEIVSKEKYLISEVVVDKITSQEGSSQVSEDMTKVLVLDPSQPVKTKGRTRNFLRFQSRKEAGQQEKQRVKKTTTMQTLSRKWTLQNSMP